MWRTTALRHRYAIKDGMEVIVRGKITMYPPHGRISAHRGGALQKGVGAQDLALRKLKEKLHKLGYFAPERKRPLPAFPRRIVLVASPTGAAIRDMLEIIGRRWPARGNLGSRRARARGRGGARNRLAALDRLNDFAGIDVIILGRGGGSAAKTWPPSTTKIVAERHLRVARFPVISAVGHEIDVTIADLVADRRAATPSEAAEIATPDRARVAADAAHRRQRLHDLLLGKYQTHRQRLQGLTQRRVFQFPLERLHDQERRIDDWDERLQRAIQLRVQRARQKLDALAGTPRIAQPLERAGSRL